MECAEAEDSSQNINKKVGGKSDGKMCPECMRHGLSNRLRLFQIGWEEAVQLCENDLCIYPMTSDPATLLTNRQAADIGTRKKRWKQQTSRKKTSIHSDISLATNSNSLPRHSPQLQTLENFVPDKIGLPVLAEDQDFLIDDIIHSEEICEFKESEFLDLVAMLDDCAGGTEASGVSEPVPETNKSALTTVDPVKIGESPDGITTVPTHLLSDCATATAEKNTVCEILENGRIFNFKPIAAPGTFNKSPNRCQATSLTLQKNCDLWEFTDLKAAKHGVSTERVEIIEADILPNSHSVNGRMLGIDKNKTDLQFDSDPNANLSRQKRDLQEFTELKAAQAAQHGVNLSDPTRIVSTDRVEIGKAKTLLNSRLVNGRMYGINTNKTDLQVASDPITSLTLQNHFVMRGFNGLKAAQHGINLSSPKRIVSTERVETGANNILLNCHSINGKMFGIDKSKTDLQFASDSGVNPSETLTKFGQRGKSPRQNELQSNLTEISVKDETKGGLDIFSCLDIKGSKPARVRTSQAKSGPYKRVRRSIGAALRETEYAAHSRVSSWLEKEQTPTKQFSGYQSKKKQKTVVKDVGSVSDDSGIQSPLSGRSEESSGSRPIR